MFLELLKRFIKRKDKPIKENTIQQNIIYNFDRLKKSGNTYSFSGSVPFEGVHRLKDDTINKVFRFAYDMAYTDKGHHHPLADTSPLLHIHLCIPFLVQEPDE